MLTLGHVWTLCCILQGNLFHQKESNIHLFFSSGKYVEHKQLQWGSTACYVTPLYLDVRHYQCSDWANFVVVVVVVRAISQVVR